MSPEEQDAIRRFHEQGGQVRKMQAVPPPPKKTPKRGKAARWGKSQALRPGGRYS